jgi:hypothetical protein
MAYIRGTQVRPELGAGNFGPILAGGQQKAASIQRGMESLGQGIAGGIQQYSATKREDAKTAKLDAEQKKLYEGRIEGAKLQLNAAKLLYGNDPKISAELDAGLRLLDNPELDPATRAAASEQAVQGIALLTQQGALNRKADEDAAKAQGLERGLLALADSADTLGITMPFDLRGMVNSGPAEYGQRAQYLEGLTSAVGNNTQVLERMKIAQREDVGFPTLNEAAASAWAGGADGLSVQQNAQGRWLVQASFRKAGEEPSPTSPLKIGGREVVFEWDKLSKKYVDPKTGVGRDMFFYKDEYSGAPAFNVDLWDKVYGDKPMDSTVDGMPVDPVTEFPLVNNAAEYNKLRKGEKYTVIVDGKREIRTKNQ